MPITTEIEKDYGGTIVKVDGMLLACITKETPRQAVAKFIEMCKINERGLARMSREYEAKCQWNGDNPGQGKDWPIFGIREKTISRMCRDAGIIDS